MRDINDPILAAIKKYEKHSSIIKIAENIVTNEVFKLSPVSCKDVVEVVKSLNISNAATSKNIPTKVFKQNSDKCASLVTGIHNKFTIYPQFSLKLGNMLTSNPAHKKGDYTDKDNYRPVRSHLLWRNTFQIDFVDLGKAIVPQLTLIVMLEEMRKHLDKGNACSMILTDLSKAFDCIKHDLLIAKLNAYGFDHSLSLIVISPGENSGPKLVLISVTGRKSFQVAAQGSIIGPLVFNIYINDIFFFTEETEITNYADDNTPICV